MMFFAPTFSARGDDNHSPADEPDARTHEDDGDNFAYRAHAPFSRNAQPESNENPGQE
jgi:hypothetical protein